LVQDLIRDLLSSKLGTFTFGGINYKFRTLSERNTGVYTIYWDIKEGADLKVVVKFMKVFVTWWDSAYS